MWEALHHSNLEERIRGMVSQDSLRTATFPSMPMAPPKMNGDLAFNAVFVDQIPGLHVVESVNDAIRVPLAMRQRFLNQDSQG